MAIFNLSHPITLADVKTRYKELVKRHHPDANGGDKQAEERFKLITQAYTVLRSFVTE
jgi:DnaJ-class molecular chaperone